MYEKEPGYSGIDNPIELEMLDAGYFLEIEKAKRKHEYRKVRDQLKRIYKLQNPNGNQYHTLYTSNGQRKVLLNKTRPERQEIWHIVVNDEYTNETLGRTLKILDFVMPVSINNISLQESMASRSHYEHSWGDISDCGPIIQAHQGITLKLVKGKNYDYAYGLDHSFKGMKEVFSRCDAAIKLSNILSHLDSVTHEPQFELA